MASYKNAIRYKNSPAYPYAVYKLGWTYYNADVSEKSSQWSNYKKALVAFKLVVRLSDKNKKKGGLNLRNEAINDLVMVWSETEGVDDAYDYFSKLNEMEAFYDVLEKLGHTYAEQGKNKRSLQAFNRLLKEAPHRERNPEIYAKVVDLHDQTGQLSEVIKDVDQMHELYDKKSVWTRAHAKNRELLKEASQKTEKIIHRYAASYHKQGQKTKRDTYMKAAMQLYQKYLEFYPKNPNAYEIRYYLADVYFHFKMYEPASDEYLKVALQDRKGKYFTTSALNSVVAINTLVDEKKWDPLPKPGQAEKPIRIPREKKKLIRAVDTYVKLIPSSKEGNAMLFSAADIYFQHGHYDDALNRFEQLALGRPQTKQGKVALETILSFHTGRSEWQTVGDKARKYMKSQKITDPKMVQLMLSHLKNSVYKQGIWYAKNKQYVKAANTFLAYQKEFPKDQDADKALYNASINFYKNASIDHALKTDRLLITQYPKSKMVKDVTLNMAQTYESIATFPEAAQYYSLFAKKYPTDDRAANALYNSATLYRGLKQYELSLNLYGQFVTRYPSHPEAPETYYEMAMVYEKIEDYRTAVNSLATYLSKSNKVTPDRRLYVQAKIAQLKFEKYDRIAGQNELARLAGYFRSGPQVVALDARRIVAETMFSGLDSEYSRFNQVKFRSAKNLEKDVTQKQALLLNLAKRYQEVIDVGSGEYMVASLYSLGQLHSQFATDLFKTPNPAGADQVTIDQFRSSIEKVAFPLREEAYKYYELAYKKSDVVETFTGWTQMAYKKMAELYPEKHPEILEQTASPDYLSHKLAVDDDVSILAEN